MAGRPTAYKAVSDNLEQIKKWKSLGATDDQICSQLGIGKTSFYKYKKEHPEFTNCLKDGVNIFIADLKGELATLAKKHTLETKKTYIKKDIETGATTQYTEITNREVDGNISAIHLLLKNLDKDNWKNDWDNYELKQQELQLRKQMADSKEWN